MWLIAAIEHYTAVLGDFALNCTWDQHGAHPTIVDLFRWHGSEEVEHRIRAMAVAARIPHAVGFHTLTYFRPTYSPEDMLSTAQAVANLATSPAARAAHL